MGRLPKVPAPPNQVKENQAKKIIKRDFESYNNTIKHYTAPKPRHIRTWLFWDTVVTVLIVIGCAVGCAAGFGALGALIGAIGSLPFYLLSGGDTSFILKGALYFGMGGGIIGLIYGIIVGIDIV